MTIYFDERTGAYHRIDELYSDGEARCTEVYLTDDGEYVEEIHETDEHAAMPKNSGYYLTAREIKRMTEV